ncbi:MAG: hypothetical protein DMG23_13055 [Acidobacteria bacterium]|nr:MAG: hypothetical protein DMG23_13055 [Acidobacteriota bacterium]
MLRGWWGILTSVAILGYSPTLTPVRGQTPAASLPGLVSLEQINLEEFEPAIRDQILRAHEEATKEPQSGAKVGRLGMIFQVYGKYELAETCYLRARALDPRSFRWAYYLGHVQGLLGKQTQAIESIGEALKIDNGYAPARVRLAQLLFDAGDTEQNARIYRELIDHNSDLAPAYFGLGQVLAAREDWAGAIESYRRACEIAMNYAPAQYALAMAYRKTGDLDKARAHLELYQRVKQTKQPPFDRLMDDVKALYSGGLTHFAKGSSLAQQGKLQEAAAEFESALEVNPGLVMAHANLIAMYGQLGLPDKAEQHYRAAVELDPGWVEVYYNWGMSQLQHGKKAEAAEMFRKAIEVNPTYADAHVQLASLLDEGGRLEEAAEHYQRALAVNPDHWQAHFLFAYNLARSGQINEAIKHFLETIKVEDSRTPICMHALAIAYERAGNRERALYYLHQARQRAASFGMQDLLSQLQRDLNRLTAEGARP